MDFALNAPLPKYSLDTTVQTPVGLGATRGYCWYEYKKTWTYEVALFQEDGNGTNDFDEPELREPSFPRSLIIPKGWSNPRYILGERILLSQNIIDDHQTEVFAIIVGMTYPEGHWEYTYYRPDINSYDSFLESDLL